MISLGSIVRYAPHRLVFNTAEALRDNALNLPRSVLSTNALADIYGQGRNTPKSSAYAPHPIFSRRVYYSQLHRQRDAWTETTDCQPRVLCSSYSLLGAYGHRAC